METKPTTKNRTRDWYRYQRERLIVKRIKRVKQLQDFRTPADIVPGHASKSGFAWLGCGNPRCWLCHHEKFSGAPLPRDIRAGIV